jgi:RNA polymerase sigma factor (sigma-70 family)
MLNDARDGAVVRAELPARLRAGTDVRAARGDASAFALVYDHHHQALYRYCRSILRHDEDAQDALQSTMEHAFAAVQHEPRDIEWRPWLFRIAHNEAISILRRRREATERDETAGADREIEDRLADREAIRALRADLADLSERQRTALVLRELNGLGHKEIAQLLGCSPGAVKQAIFEARGALLKCREGREMACHDVQRALSDGDGRRLRERRLRSHLRTCPECRVFRADLRKRPRILQMLGPPLPSGSAAAQLQHLLAGQAGATGAYAAAGAGTVTAKIVIAITVAATAIGGAGMAARSLRTSPPAPSPSPAAPAQLAVGAPASDAAGRRIGSAPLRSTTTPARRADPRTAAGPAPRTRVGAAVPEDSPSSADKGGVSDRGATATADPDGPHAARREEAPGPSEPRAEQPVPEAPAGQSDQSSPGGKGAPARDRPSRRPDELPGTGRDRPGGAGDPQRNRGPGQPPAAGGGSAPAGAPPAATGQGAADTPAPPSGGPPPDASEGTHDGSGRADTTGDRRGGDGQSAHSVPPGSR